MGFLSGYFSCFSSIFMAPIHHHPPARASRGARPRPLPVFARNYQNSNSSPFSGVLIAFFPVFFVVFRCSLCRRANWSSFASRRACIRRRSFEGGTPTRSSPGNSHSSALCICCCYVLLATGAIGEQLMCAVKRTALSGNVVQIVEQMTIYLHDL